METEELEVKPIPTATLVPIKRLDAVEQTTVLKPVSKGILNPVKKRGAPPSSAPGMKPGSEPKTVETTTLKPVTILRPVNPPNTDLNLKEKKE